MKILVAEPLAKQGLEILRAHHEVDEKIGLSPEELAAIIGEYDALLVRSQVKVTAEILAHATRLVVIGRAGVGVDNVDLEAATKAGIVVVNAPTGNTVSAAEQTIALMLALARKTAAADASMRRGEWKRSSFTGVELRGRTLGIIGLGKIGQAVADRAAGLEMNVIGYDPFVTAEQAALHGVTLVELDAIIEQSDVITVHVPLNKATRDIVGAEQIARMKPGVMLVNVASRRRLQRGGRGPGPDRRQAGRRRVRRLRSRAAGRLADSEGPQHGPHPAPGRPDGRGSAPRRRGSLRAGDRRTGRPVRPVRGQRPAADAGDGPGDRPIHTPDRDPRPDRGAVLPPCRQDAHRGRRGRPGRSRRLPADRGGTPGHPRKRDDRAGQPDQRRRSWPRTGASP